MGICDVITGVIVVAVWPLKARLARECIGKKGFEICGRSRTKD